MSAYYRELMSQLNRLTDEQWFAVLCVVMVAGFFCMRGFGSRNNY